jgi:hypothetical protein
MRNFVGTNNVFTGTGSRAVGIFAYGDGTPGGQDVTGTEYADGFFGSEFVAGSGNDSTFHGLGGNDSHFGGAATTAIDGGSGTDTSSYDGIATIAETAPAGRSPRHRRHRHARECRDRRRQRGGVIRSSAMAAMPPSRRDRRRERRRHDPRRLRHLDRESERQQGRHHPRRNNHGIDGTAARGAETVIDGQIVINAAGATIDGVKLIGDAPGSLGNTAVEVKADNFTLVNSILAGTGDTAIIVGLVTGLDIGHNLIRAIRSAPMSGGGTTGSIHDNRFQGDGGPITGLGNGVNSETSHVAIADNAFDGIYAGTLNLFPFGPDSVDLNSYITGNTITNSGAPARSRSCRPTRPTTSSAPTSTRRSTARRRRAATASPARSASTAAAATTAPGAASGATRFTGGSGDDELFGNGGNDTRPRPPGPAVRRPATAGRHVRHHPGGDRRGVGRLYDPGRGRHLMPRPDDRRRRHHPRRPGRRGGRRPRCRRRHRRDDDHRPRPGHGDRQRHPERPSLPQRRHHHDRGGTALQFLTGGGATGHLVTNSIFWSTIAGGANGVDDRAISTVVIADGLITITDNLISGTSHGQFGTASWGRGIWFDGGGVDLVVTGNTIEWTRSGLNLDMSGDSTANVSNNVLRGLGTGIAIGVDAVGLTVVGNDDRAGRRRVQLPQPDHRRRPSTPASRSTPWCRSATSTIRSSFSAARATTISPARPEWTSSTATTARPTPMPPTATR